MRAHGRVHHRRCDARGASSCFLHADWSRNRPSRYVRTCDWSERWDRRLFRLEDWSTDLPFELFLRCDWSRPLSLRTDPCTPPAPDAPLFSSQTGVHLLREGVRTIRTWVSSAWPRLSVASPALHVRHACHPRGCDVPACAARRSRTCVRIRTASVSTHASSDGR